MTDSIKGTIQIKYRGKLPNSSYYELPADRILVNSTNLIPASVADSPNPIIRINRDVTQQQTPVLNPDQIVNTNLYVRSCVFSPDGIYLAWSCGYGVVKIMKWKDSTTRKRTISNEANTTCSFLVDGKLSPTKMQKQQEQSPIPRSNENNDVSTPYLIPPANASVFQTPTSLNNSPTVDYNDQTINNIDEIAEIDCGELVWSLAFGSTTSFVKHRRDVHRQPRVNTRFNFAQQSLILAVGLNSGKIRIYNGMSGTFLLGLYDHKDVLNDLKFTKDGSLQLASVSNDTTIKLWDFYDDGNMYKTLTGHVGKVIACDWSPTASLLCSVGVNRQVFIWDTEKFIVKHVLRGHLHDVVTCEFSPDGALVATGSYDTKIFLWDPYSGSLIRQLFHMLPPPRSIYASGYNDAYIRSLAFSKGGDHLVSVCDDKKLRIWSLCSRSMYPIAETTQNKGICCAYSSDSKTIMIGTKNGYVDIYEAPIMIQRLVDISRKVVNQYVDHDQISKLALPNELKSFLLYNDIKEQTVNSNPSTTINTTTASRSPLSTYHSPTLCN